MAQITVRPTGCLSSILAKEEKVSRYIYAKRPKGWNKHTRTIKKTAASMKRTAVDSVLMCFGLTAAGRTAGARLHAREHETLAFLEIDVRGFEHIVRTLFQEYLQTLQFKGRIAF